MLFCTFFFTACGNGELEAKVKDLEKQIQTLQSAQTATQSELNITKNELNTTKNELNQYKAEANALSNKDAMQVLANVQNFATNPSDYATLDVSSSGAPAMTSYAGIKDWKINSVDFVTCLGDTYNNQSNRLMPNLDLHSAAGVPLLLLDENVMNINEDYQKCFSASGTYRANLMYKIEMSENEMVIYMLNELVNGTTIESKTALRVYVTFTDVFSIKNVVVEKYQHRLSDGDLDMFVQYYFNSWVYSCAMENNTVLGSGFATSMVSEFSKAVKADEAFDLSDLIY